MQNAETVLDVLRERGRQGLPLDELYRQLFNPQLYLVAYGRLYSNKGAMTPGPDAETADGMTLAKIGRIIDALRHERYRFKPVKRTYIPKKNGKRRPLGLPSWSDKLVAEVVRLLATVGRSRAAHGAPPVVGHFAAALVEQGADGLVLFNRLLQPDIDLVRLLLSRKADPAAKDDSGQTPLDIATFQKHKRVAKLLSRFSTKK